MSNKTETITIKTDNQGKATFDLSEVEYLRA
jgi:hypothetical protein